MREKIRTVTPIDKFSTSIHKGQEKTYHVEHRRRSPDPDNLISTFQNKVQEETHQLMPNSMTRAKRNRPLHKRQQRLPRPQLTLRDPLQQLFSCIAIVVTLFQTSMILHQSFQQTRQSLFEMTGRLLVTFHITQPFNAVINRPHSRCQPQMSRRRGSHARITQNQCRRTTRMLKMLLFASRVCRARIIIPFARTQARGYTYQFCRWRIEFVSAGKTLFLVDECFHVCLREPGLESCAEHDCYLARIRIRA